MKQTPTKPGGEKTAKPAGGRDDRLKAALRANLQRRKAQARARDTGEQDGPENGSEDGLRNGPKTDSPPGDNEKEN